MTDHNSNYFNSFFFVIISFKARSAHIMISSMLLNFISILYKLNGYLSTNMTKNS